MIVLWYDDLFDSLRCNKCKSTPRQCAFCSHVALEAVAEGALGTDNGAAKLQAVLGRYMKPSGVIVPN